MKVADYIIQTLEDHGISHAFLVYGAANGSLVDAFTRMKNIKYVCAQHEQAAGFMAEGYAKVSGNFGVAIATSGPGGMNLVTPIGNCFYDSVPCLFLTGQVKTQFMRPDDSIRQIGFQETDIVSIVTPITKYAVMITDAKDVPTELEKAIAIMKSGRPGPVLIDLPIDVQKADIKVKHSYRREMKTPLPSVANHCRMLLNAIKNSKRPYILVGGGARRAIMGIKYISDKFNIPVSPTWNAIDLVTSDWPNYAGRVGTYGGDGRNFGIQNCDLLICIGTRISGRITGGDPESFARSAKKWVIDIDKSNDEALKSQGIKIDNFIHADANHFLHEFVDFVEKNVDKQNRLLDGYFDKWMIQCLAWKERYDPVKLHLASEHEYVNPYAFMRMLSNLCGPHDIIVSDCGGNQVIFAHSFKTKDGQRCFTNNGNSPMGFSMCGAMGAWFAQTKKQPSPLMDKLIDSCNLTQFTLPGENLTVKEWYPNVICIIGDGGMQMNIQELQTMKNYGIIIIVIVLINHIYGITKAFQKVNFEGRAEACEPPHYTVPDFAKIASSYGISNISIHKNEDINIALQQFLKMPGPSIMDVNCHDWHEYYPKISGWKTPIEDMEPLLSNEEFINNMLIPISKTSKCARGLIHVDK